MSGLSEGPQSLDLCKLTRVAGKLVPAEGQIGNLQRLSGGASQETWAFDICDGVNVESFILRRAPGGDFQHETAAGLEVEAAIISAMDPRAVPVPTVRYVLSPDDGLGRGFFTSHVDGETIARKILRDDQFDEIRPRLPQTFGAVLANIHATPLDTLPVLRSADAAQTLDMLRRGTSELPSPRPVFELALRWLTDRLPGPVNPALVHGDFRLGNVIIAPDAIRAVLDWELVHIGDPMEDLAWLCTTPWRFGAVDLPVAGLGEREQLYAGYEAAGGSVDRDRVRWWEILSALRWGVNCAAMVPLYRNGTDTSVERTMIARRASENEIDLLRLIYLDD